MGNNDHNYSSITLDPIFERLEETNRLNNLIVEIFKINIFKYLKFNVINFLEQRNINFNEKICSTNFNKTLSGLIEKIEKKVLKSFLHSDDKKKMNDFVEELSFISEKWSFIEWIKNGETFVLNYKFDIERPNYEEISSEYKLLLSNKNLFYSLSCLEILHSFLWNSQFYDSELDELIGFKFSNISKEISNKINKYNAKYYWRIFKLEICSMQNSRYVSFLNEKYINQIEKNIDFLPIDTLFDSFSSKNNNTTIFKDYLNSLQNNIKNNLHEKKENNFISKKRKIELYEKFKYIDNFNEFIYKMFKRKTFEFIEYVVNDEIARKNLIGSTKTTDRSINNSERFNINSSIKSLETFINKSNLNYELITNITKLFNSLIINRFTTYADYTEYLRLVKSCFDNFKCSYSDLSLSDTKNEIDYILKNFRPINSLIALEVLNSCVIKYDYFNEITPSIFDLFSKKIRKLFVTRLKNDELIRLKDELNIYYKMLSKDFRNLVYRYSIVTNNCLNDEELRKRILSEELAKENASNNSNINLNENLAHIPAKDSVIIEQKKYESDNDMSPLTCLKIRAEQRNWKSEQAKNIFSNVLKEISKYENNKTNDPDRFEFFKDSIKIVFRFDTNPDFNNIEFKNADRLDVYYIDDIEDLNKLILKLSNNIGDLNLKESENNSQSTIESEINDNKKEININEELIQLYNEFFSLKQDDQNYDDKYIFLDDFIIENKDKFDYGIVGEYLDKYEKFRLKGLISEKSYEDVNESNDDIDKLNYSSDDKISVENKDNHELKDNKSIRNIYYTSEVKKFLKSNNLRNSEDIKDIFEIFKTFELDDLKEKNKFLAKMCKCFSKEKQKLWRWHEPYNGFYVIRVDKFRNRLVYFFDEKKDIEKSNSNDIYIRTYVSHTIGGSANTEYRFSKDYEKLNNINRNDANYRLYIEYSQNQLEVIDSLSTCLDDIEKFDATFLTGCAGSGKTLIATDFYRNYIDKMEQQGAKNSDMIFLTFNSNAQQYICTLMEKNNMPIPQINTDNIFNFFKSKIRDYLENKFSGYKFMFSNDQDALNLKSEDAYNFTKWWNNFIYNNFSKENSRQRLSNTIGKDYDSYIAYTLYRGFFKGSLIRYESDSKNSWGNCDELISRDILTNYFQDEFTFCNLLKENNIKYAEDFYSAFLTYQNELISKSSGRIILDENDCARIFAKLNLYSKGENGFKYCKYKCLTIDEVQDLTNVELFALLTCLEANGKLCICGDKNQCINPTLFNVSDMEGCFRKINSNFDYNKKFSVRSLSETFRYGEKLVKYINKIVEYRDEKFGQFGQKLNSISKNNEHFDAFYSCDSKFNYEIIKELLGKKIKCIIIVPNDKTKTELESKLSNDNIVFKSNNDSFTKNNIGDKIIVNNLIETVFNEKGLEDDNVVIYNFISANKKIYNEIDLDSMTNSFFHKMIFNQFYVGCTRARKKLLILEDALNSSDRYYNVFINNQLDMLNNANKLKFIMSDEKRDFFEEAKEYFNTQRYGLARDNFEDALNYNGNDADIQRKNEILNYMEICELMLDKTKYNKNLAMKCKQNKFFKEASAILSELPNTQGLVDFYDARSKKKSLTDYEIKQIFKKYKNDLDDDDIQFIIENSTILSNVDNENIKILDGISKKIEELKTI